MSNDPDFAEAHEALESLASALQHPDGRDLVVEELAHLEALYRRGNESTRYKVLIELIDIGFSGACGILLEALRGDPSALVRHEAAFGLSLLGGPRQVQALVDALLYDDSEIVRHEAAISLSQIGVTSVEPELMKALKDESELVAASARFAIEELRLYERDRQ